MEIQPVLDEMVRVTQVGDVMSAYPADELQLVMLTCILAGLGVGLGVGLFFWCFYKCCDFLAAIIAQAFTSLRFWIRSRKR